MSEIDVPFLIDLLRRAAKAEILPRFRALGPTAVREKSSPLDLVTDADEAAEAMISAELRARYPEALILGEEAAALDPSLLQGFDQAGLCFVIDPIDGTANFAAGLTLFGVMLAVLRQGRVVCGLIYDPIADDCAVAVEGEGAWMLAADGACVRLRVATPAPFAAMSGNLSWRYFPPAQQPAVLAAARRFGGSFDFRCAAHQYRMMAGGHCQFLVFYRLLPWDHAAGSLLVREAGGYAALLDGRDYQPAILEGGYLCATDRDSWHSIMQLFGDPAPR